MPIIVDSVQNVVLRTVDRFEDLVTGWSHEQARPVTAKCQRNDRIIFSNNFTREILTFEVWVI